MYQSRYSLIVTKGPQIVEIPFSENGKTGTKAFLEQIDYVTANYKDLGSFLTMLKNNKVIEFNPDSCAIKYKAMGEIKKLDLIFDDKLVAFAAMDVLKKKKQNESKASIDLNDEMLKLINRVKAYAINPESFKSIKNSHTFPWHVRQLLEEYLKYNDVSYESSSKQADINELNNTLAYRISEYKNFRDIVVWEKKYKAKLEKNNQPIIEDYVQMKLIDYFEHKDEIQKTPEQIEYEKDLEASADVLQERANEEAHKNINRLNDKYTELSDKEVETTFNAYGIKGVEYAYSEEKIASLPDEDLYAMGFDISRFRENTRGR